MAPRIWGLTAIGVVAAVSVAAAQEAVSAFPDLQRILKAGDTITVSDISGASLKGSLIELTASSLVLQVGATERTYSQTEVVHIRQRYFDSLVNGALIGAGVGAAVAAIALSHCTTDLGCSDMAGPFLGLSMGVGLGMGLGLDALQADERIVFDRTSGQRARVRLAPFVGLGCLGAVVSTRF